MKVMVGLPDMSGCGYYRGIWPGQEVLRLGHDVQCVTKLNLTLMDADGVPRVVDFGTEADTEWDLAVLSRPLRRIDYETVTMMRRRGIAVVVDIDDDFDAVDPAHMSWSRFQPDTNPESNKHWLKMACHVADLVTCTTPALAKRYAPHGRSAVLPNFVPKAMLGTLPYAPRDGRTVGWGGFVGTHPSDLPVTRGGVAQALTKTGARFLNVGSGQKVKEQLGLGTHEFEATGSAEFDDYPHRIAQFDVGIVPLADTPFNAAKSALKGLEYAAVGVPFVASPTDDYRRIAADGIGRLAEKSRARDWARAIEELLGPAGKEAAEEARAAVIAKHLYEDNGWRWLEAWEQAIENRKADLETPVVRSQGLSFSK